MFSIDVNALWAKIVNHQNVNSLAAFSRDVKDAVPYMTIGKQCHEFRYTSLLRRINIRKPTFERGWQAKPDGGLCLMT